MRKNFLRAIIIYKYEKHFLRMIDCSHVFTYIKECNYNVTDKD